MTPSYIYLNKEFIPEDKALIHVSDRGFRFGDGVFETCRIVDGIIYNYSSHGERLQNGLRAIRINFSCTDLESLSYDLISRNKILDGYLRISVSRGCGSAGYLPLKNINPTIAIETLPLRKTIQTPVSLWVSDIAKSSISSAPVNFKLAQGLNSIMAKIQAEDNGCFDSILLNDFGQVCETSSANIFWVRDNILYTSDHKIGVLQGTIREKIIQTSLIEVKLVRADLKELLKAEEIFITNVNLGVARVGAIMPINKIFQTDKYSKIFSNLLNKDIEDYVAKRKNEMA